MAVRSARMDNFSSSKPLDSLAIIGTSQFSSMQQDCVGGTAATGAHALPQNQCRFLPTVVTAITNDAMLTTVAITHRMVF